MQKKVLITLLSSALLVVGCDSDDNGSSGSGAVSDSNASEGSETETTEGSTDPSEGSTDPTDASEATTDPSEATTDPTEGTSESDTESGASDTDTSDTSETGISSGFITDPDGGGVSIECSLWDQDCGDGEKCAPWANDGGSAWNATRGVPVDAAPAQPGDSCTVEGSGVSGIDTCDVSSMCWDVDPETNEGVCTAFCTGSENAPVCDDPSTSCSIANEGVIVLCLPTCNPLIQNCSEGQACYPIDDSFVCAPDASGEDMGADNDPCEYINACDAGTVCVVPDIVEGCPAGSAGCCQFVCDLSEAMPDGCSASETCEAFFEEGNVPPGYEDVGICSLPT